MASSKVLFILKRRLDYHLGFYGTGVSTGLLNSATFVKDMLIDAGIDAKLVIVVDNNDIDREVTLYRPTHVIIEAIWVVPTKFDVLFPLHPDVKWIVRLHSELPFIAGEGMAMKWIMDYLHHPNVILSANSPRMLSEVRQLIGIEFGYSHQRINRKVLYLPNYYPVDNLQPAQPYVDNDYIHIGCFGAIRPLKNQLLQSVAALEFATSKRKKLNFHINIGRIEMKGEPILHNLQGLFAAIASKGHILTTHQWMDHAQFLALMPSIDLGLQVSFSETFNIVAADLTASGIPIVISKEVLWAFPYYADPTSSQDIVSKMTSTWRFRKASVFLNQRSLSIYSKQSRDVWLDYFT